jgi:hypothetical protein
MLDRVFHMLKDDRDRLAVLEEAGGVTRSGGCVLVAATPKHQCLIRSFFADRSEKWVKVRDRKGFTFARKRRVRCGLIPAACSTTRS